MKYTIKNLIGSPYNVPTAEGVVHIPARGEVVAELDGMTLHNIKSMQIFEIAEAAEQPKAALDSEPKKRGRPRKEA